jgi:hypothetical protein
MRKGLAAAAGALALAGCGQHAGGTTATTTAAKGNDKAHALSAWKRFIAKRARSYAALAGYKVIKVKADMDDPRDYGKGFKEGRGTAYVALENPERKRHTTIYRGEVDQRADGNWAVKPKSVEPCFCPPR